MIFSNVQSYRFRSKIATIVSALAKPTIKLESWESANTKQIPIKIKRGERIYKAWQQVSLDQCSLINIATGDQRRSRTSRINPGKVQVRTCH